MSFEYGTHLKYAVDEAKTWSIVEIRRIASRAAMWLSHQRDRVGKQPIRLPRSI